MEELTTFFIDLAAFLEGYSDGYLDLKMAEGGITLLFLGYLGDHAQDQVALGALRRAASEMFLGEDFINQEYLNADLVRIAQQRGLIERKLEEER